MEIVFLVRGRFPWRNFYRITVDAHHRSPTCSRKENILRTDQQTETLDVRFCEGNDAREPDNRRLVPGLSRLILIGPTHCLTSSGRNHWMESWSLCNGHCDSSSPFFLFFYRSRFRDASSTKIARRDPLELDNEDVSSLLRKQSFFSHAY